MAVSEGLIKELESTQKFFKTTLSIFESGDAGFAPYPELYTVAGHVAHTADTIDWFIEGGLRQRQGSGGGGLGSSPFRVDSRHPGHGRCATTCSRVRNRRSHGSPSRIVGSLRAPDRQRAPYALFLRVLSAPLR